MRAVKRSTRRFLAARSGAEDAKARLTRADFGIRRRQCRGHVFCAAAFYLLDSVRPLISAIPRVFAPWICVGGPGHSGRRAVEKVCSRSQFPSRGVTGGPCPSPGRSRGFSFVSTAKVVLALPRRWVLAPTRSGGTRYSAGTEGGGGGKDGGGAGRLVGAPNVVYPPLMRTLLRFRGARIRDTCAGLKK